MIEDDPFDFFAQIDWFLERGIIVSPVMLADLLEQQVGMADVQGVDSVSIPCTAAMQIVAHLREFPKGTGAKAGRVERMPSDTVNRLTVIGVAEMRRDELKRDKVRGAAEIAAAEAADLAIKKFGIYDLSAGTIQRQMRHRGAKPRAPVPRPGRQSPK